MERTITIKKQLKNKILWMIIDLFVYSISGIIISLVIPGTPTGKVIIVTSVMAIATMVMCTVFLGVTTQLWLKKILSQPIQTEHDLEILTKKIKNIERFTPSAMFLIASIVKFICLSIAFGETSLFARLILALSCALIVTGYGVGVKKGRNKKKAQEQTNY